jgi:hypothetical protein
MTVITKNPRESNADTAALPPASQPIELLEGMWDRIAQQAYALGDGRIGLAGLAGCRTDRDGPHT